MLAAVPAASKGTLTDKDARWIVRGVQAGYGSPVTDGERLYLVDNGGVLFAFDVKTGKQLWTEKLGTIQKSSPVLADGKLYVGTENGKPAASSTSSGRTPTGAEILDEDGLGTRRTAGGDHRARPPSRAAASTSRRWTRSTRSDRRARRGATSGDSRRPARAAADRTGAQRRGAAAAAARHADRADSEAGRVDRARRVTRVRREGARPWRARADDVDAREAEGHDRRTASFTADAASGAQAGTGQGDGRRRCRARRASA